MKPEYELFAHNYIITGDKYKAYKAAFPNASGQSLQVAARRLINKPDVRQYIHKQLTDVQEKLAGQARADEQRRINEEAASVAIIRKALRDIITGEKKVQKFFRYKNHIEIVEADMPPFAIMRAAEIEMKISNGWYTRQQKKGMEAPPANTQAAETTYNLHPDDLWELKYGPDYVPGLRAEMVRDNPRMAEEYRQKGERVLDHIMTREEIEKMKEAQERKFAEWRELKKFADEYIDEDLEINTDETSGEENELLPEPPSIPQIYPHRDTPAEMKPVKETPAPAIKKIIIAQPQLNETDCNNCPVGLRENDITAYPEYASDAAANPYIRTGIPKHLEGKVNPLSRPRPMQRRQYTEEEMDAISEKDYQAAIREEGSCFYLPPEEREGATYKKYIQNLGLPPKNPGCEQEE